MRPKFSVIFILIAIIGQINTKAALYTRGRSSGDKATINSLSIHIQPHGSYLDITERAIISPNLPQEDSVWIQGSFSLPSKATIVHFILSDSNNVFSSKILPNYKGEFPVDSTLGDPLVKISLISSTLSGANNYSITIAALTPKKHYGISIRYLIPNTGSAVADYNLNVLWHNPNLMPGIMEFSFKGEVNGPIYALNLGNSNFQLKDGQSLQIPYQENYRLLATDNAGTKQHISSFEDGDFKGQYLLLNTTVPDSVLSQLSKPIELLFLWRWNKPTCFVKKYTGGNSWLTTYGQNAIEQASAINTMVKHVAITGNQTGMVHSIQYRKPEIFPLCKKNSASFNVLTSYLSQMDEDYFLNSGYYEEITNPTNPDDTLSDSSRIEFLKSLNIVKGLYSNGAGIMKHLIIVTCGPVRNSRDIITLEELDPLINDISVSCDRAFWKDVSFANVEGGSFRRDFVDLDGFKVPQFRPSSLILQLANTGKSYSFPLSIDQNSFSIIAKSEGTWSPQIVWYGFDKSGIPFDTAHSTALVYQSVKDTGLVKLWATNSERISEKLEFDIETQYGVISKNNDMMVYPSFKWNDTAMGYATAYNYFTHKQTPVNKHRPEPTGYCFSLRNRTIKIALPGKEQIKRLKIFSLGGSLIADLDPSSFKAGFEYLIALNAIFPTRTSGLYLFVIEGNNRSWKQRLWVRN